MSLREIWNKKLNYSGLYFPFVKYNGIVWGGGRDGQLVTSNDDWKTLTSIRSIGVSEEITSINFFSSGVMIVGTYSGNVYRSVSPYNVFTKVLDMVGTAAWPLTWSVTGSGSLIFIGEYGGKDNDPAANGRRVYKSADNGLTWVQCWINPFATGSHLHKLLFDPYTNNLYVCSGDGALYARVRKLSPPNYDTDTVLVSGIQPTGGLVFQDFNLWVQDIGPYGIYKHDKAINAITLVLDLSQFAGYDDTGFDGLSLAADGVTVYYATFPSVNPSIKKAGLFKSSPPYTEWKQLSSIEEFTNSATTSFGVRHIYSASDKEIYGQFAWMPNPYGVRRTRGIKFEHFTKGLRT